MDSIRVMVFPLALKLNHFPTPSFLGYGSESWFSEKSLGCFNPSDDCIRVSWTFYTITSSGNCFVKISVRQFFVVSFIPLPVESFLLRFSLLLAVI